ncbi:hydrolase [Psychromonas marina]|uniref:Hydrolase n=1 Tax=Psychromonas marina TaxID=88364 RepID=A0ABQ6E130_9GAMM|nr:Cof-type HAD-IIB family hydrolase [Psychromonas marina]GLS91045.1 hydrolase [Psychromonas marina]
MYKIMASDLDGTLLTSDHKILPFTQKTLTQLHQQGKEFAFATGRHHIDVGQMREQLGIPAYMITSNGACIHNSENELVFQQNLSADVISQVINSVKNDPQININIYRHDDWLANKIDEKTLCGHANFPCSLFDINNPPLENVSKIFLTHQQQDHENLAGWEEKLKTQLSDFAHVTFSSPSCLEIMDSGVSKGNALEAIAKLKGVTLQDCIAFGDGMNDVEMLTMAGKGIVMGTSHYRVKNALPTLEVIGNSDDQAVAHYLTEHLLLVEAS